MTLKLRLKLSWTFWKWKKNQFWFRITYIRAKKISSLTLLYKQRSKPRHHEKKAMWKHKIIIAFQISRTISKKRKLLHMTVRTLQQFYTDFFHFPCFAEKDNVQRLVMHFCNNPSPKKISLFRGSGNKIPVQSSLWITGNSIRKMSGGNIAPRPSWWLLRSV